MRFGQPTFRQCLRDITTMLNLLDSHHYHMGIKHEVPLSTFADSNANHPWQVCQQLSMVIIDLALQHLGKVRDFDTITKSVYAHDYSTIDLC